MTTFATLNDLLEQEPTIQDYGLLDWSQELQAAQTEVIRHLKVRWYPTLNSGAVFDSTLLDETQWTKATVYYCLAHQICPKLTKFDIEGDRFQVMMDYYAKRYETEMDIAIREGVRYDADQDGSYSDSEKEPTVSLRLVR